MQSGCLDEGVFCRIGCLAGGECECVHMVPCRLLLKDGCGGNVATTNSMERAWTLIYVSWRICVTRYTTL